MIKVPLPDSKLEGSDRFSQVDEVEVDLWAEATTWSKAQRDQAVQ